LSKIILELLCIIIDVYKSQFGNVGEG